MQELKGLLLIVAVYVLPVIALAWIIYRLVKGNNGNDYSIK